MEECCGITHKLQSKLKNTQRQADTLYSVDSYVGSLAYSFIEVNDIARSTG